MLQVGPGNEGSASDPCPGRESVSNGRGGCERDRDCTTDFRFQEEAQRFFRSRGGPEQDPHELNADPEEDDLACDDLPSENDGGSGGGGDFDDDTPSGGVDSGYGPVAPERQADSPLPFALLGAGLGVLALVGIGVGRLRRSG